MYKIIIIIIIGVCNSGSIRLVQNEDGNMTNNNNEGRLEVCFIDQWGTVCSTNFFSEEAIVTCKQLGYSSTCKNNYIDSLTCTVIILFTS